MGIKHLLLPDGSDYSLMPQVLTFSDSITVQQVVPIIIPDDIVEDEESFGLTLEIVGEDAINVQILPSQVTVNIVDMDGKFVMGGGPNNKWNIMERKIFHGCIATNWYTRKILTD